MNLREKNYIWGSEFILADLKQLEIIICTMIFRIGF